MPFISIAGYLARVGAKIKSKFYLECKDGEIIDDEMNKNLLKWIDDAKIDVEDEEFFVDPEECDITIVAKDDETSPEEMLKSILGLDEAHKKKTFEGRLPRYDVDITAKLKIKDKKISSDGKRIDATLNWDVG